MFTNERVAEEFDWNIDEQRWKLCGLWATEKRLAENGDGDHGVPAQDEEDDETDWAVRPLKKNITEDCDDVWHTDETY